MSKDACLFTAIGMLGFLASGGLSAADAQRIEPQPLNAALRAFAEQSGLQMVYVADVADGVRSGGSDAVDAPDRALTQLLADTGLNYRFINARTVAIERSAEPGNPRSAPGAARSGREPARAPSSQLRLAALPAPAPLEPERSAAPRQLEEVIVSTRKRRESLQSVPIAVGALSAEQIFRRGIANLEAVTQQSPSMILDRGAAPQDLKIVVRGLSPTRGRQNVAVLLDGIDISSESLVTAGGSLLIDPKIFDIERIEVVKGPQNALYGRSAFAGAISYVSRMPGAEFRGGTDLEVGSDGQALLRARASGPLAGETLGGSLDAMAWSHDGYYSNSITGAGIGGQHGASVAGTLVWRPAPSLSVTGRISYEDSAHDIAAYAHPAPTAVFSVPAAALGTIVDASFPTIRGVRGTAPDAGALAITSSADPRTGRDYEGDDQQVLRGTLTVARDLDDLPLLSTTTLTSLPHYADPRASRTRTPARPAPGAADFAKSVPERARLFSQELRWQSRDEQA